LAKTTTSKDTSSKATARLSPPSGKHNPRPAEVKHGKLGPYNPQLPPGAKPRNY
jgi:hypothetical protein